MGKFKDFYFKDVSKKDDLWAFGYGSLIFPKGINEKGMKRHYSEKDLIETSLNNYRREWNAKEEREGKDHETWLGLVKAEGSITNGVLFLIDKKDLDEKKFCEYEEAGYLYKFVDVTKNIEYKDLKGMKVFTLVTKDPKYDGKIGNDYKKEIEEGLEARGKEFEKEFEKTTFRNPV